MLLIPGLLPVFSTYQLYLQIKDMKIWQQVLAQQMKPLISPNDFDSSEAPTLAYILDLSDGLLVTVSLYFL